MKRILLCTLILLLAVSCAPKPTGPQTLTVMTHDSFSVSKDVIAAFENANDAKVAFLPSGDAGAALNKAILTKDSPLADVFYGVDNTFLARALSAGIYEPYISPALQKVPAEFQLDPTHQVSPVDQSYVCVVFDKAYFASHDLSAPVTLEDLIKPEYKGLFVMENPVTSSPGLVFLLATVKHFGESNYLGYWKELRQNGLVVVDGWETAYYTNFSGSSGKGPQPLVVSYATDPAAEVMNAAQPLSEAPVGVMSGPDTCFRQIEFVGILKGTQHLALAQKFVDFMLSASFQSDLPGQMYVYPVLPNLTLPEAFVEFAQIPSQPAVLSADEIAAGRDRWIADWTNAVLK